MLVMDIIDEAVPLAKNPAELAVRLAELAIKNGADPQQVLSHLLPPGILVEENCQTQMINIRELMPKYAPLLNRQYNKLSPEQRKKLDIADIDGIFTANRLIQIFLTIKAEMLYILQKH